MGQPPPLTPDGFRRAVDVSRETLDKLRLYADRLARWQAAINLVAPSTLADPWRRHMLDSAQILSHLPADCRSVTDIGSGAGFPGLVIALVGRVPVRLVESDSRKCAFLREVVRETGAPAQVIEGRIESPQSGAAAAPVDILTARALAPLEKLCEYADLLRAPTAIFLKGKTWRDELTEARKHWTMDVDVHESRTAADARLLVLSRIAPVAADA